MKKFAGTWIVLGIFGILLAYLLIAKPKSKDERDEAKSTVVSAKRETIDRIEIVSSNGTIALAKTADKWAITAPKAYPAEDQVTNQMLTSLSSLESTAEPWKTPTDADRAKAGLAPPAATVKFHAEDGDHTLLIGKLTGEGDEYYVASPSKPGIYVARKWSVEDFGKGVDDFRRKRLFDFDRDDVRSLTVTGKGTSFAMTRLDPAAPWRATAPFQGRADRGKASNLVMKVSNLRADSFVATPDASMGLASPRAKIVLGLKDGSTHTLIVGNATPDKKYFAQEGETGTTIVSAIPIFEELDAKVDDWRDKSLFDFTVDDVTSLEVKVDGTTAGAREDDAKMWKTTEPQKDSVVNLEATAFLRSAKEATGTELGDAAPDGSAAAKRYGFDKPLLQASWVTAQQKMEVVVGAEKPGTHSRWMRTSEVPQAQLVATDLVTPARGFKDAASKAPPPPSPVPSPAASPAGSPSSAAVQGTSGSTTLTINKGT